MCIRYYCLKESLLSISFFKIRVHDMKNMCFGLDFECNTSGVGGLVGCLGFMAYQPL